MEKNGIEVRDYAEVSSDATLLASAQLIITSAQTVSEKHNGAVETNSGGCNNSAEEKSNDLVWVDPGTCCFALYSKLNPDKVFLQSSPLSLAKALKVFSSI